MGSDVIESDVMVLRRDKHDRHFLQALAHLRRTCLSLPEVRETVTFGHPTFQAGRKTFAVLEEYGGHLTVVFKTDGLEQQELVETRGDLYFVTPYIGKQGWVSAIINGKSEGKSDGKGPGKSNVKVDWKRLDRHVVASWRLLATPKMQAALKAPAPAARGATRARTSTRR